MLHTRVSQPRFSQNSQQKGAKSKPGAVYLKQVSLPKVDHRLVDEEEQPPFWQDGKESDGENNEYHNEQEYREEEQHFIQSQSSHGKRSRHS
jgi:hypothetical protein